MQHHIVAEAVAARDDRLKTKGVARAAQWPARACPAAATFDSSVGGLGGCPYAPGASGNVSTQALAIMFGDRTKLDVDQLDRAWSIVQPLMTNQA